MPVSNKEFLHRSLISDVYTAAGMQEERYTFYRAALYRYRRTGPELNAAICEHGLSGTSSACSNTAGR